MRETLLALVAVFVPFSLLSFGGGTAIIAGIQHEAVAVHGWLTPQDFVDLFAIARAAPGPGVMLATLVGWRVAGWAGATVASLALFVPSSLLCYAVFRLSNAYRDRSWHRTLRDGLAPVGIGLTIAGVVTIFRIADGGWLAALLAAASAALLLWRPDVPALAAIAAGGAITGLAALLAP